MKHSSFRFNRIWFFALVLLFALSIAGCGPYSAFTWLTAPRDEIRVIVPDRYEGHILIAWQVPNGEIAVKEDGKWVYQLQEDGALLLENDPPKQVIDWEFWYGNASGNMARIQTSTCFDSDQVKGIVVCSGMRGQVLDGFELRPNASFTITTLADFLNG